MKKDIKKTFYLVVILLIVGLAINFNIVNATNTVKPKNTIKSTNIVNSTNTVKSENKNNTMNTTELNGINFESISRNELIDDNESTISEISNWYRYLSWGLLILELVSVCLPIFIIFRLIYLVFIKKKSMSIGKILINILIVIILFCISGIISITESFKPIIYIYPEEEQEVTVKLGKVENISCSYPKYKEDGWEVIAKPDGSLTDCKTGRNLYALYWEGVNEVKPNYKEGFIVKGEDTIEFLEEKLAILGLNEKEAEEFIIYWLPQLEPNKYNYIRFETIEEINESMPLEIIPKPDTIIRVMMEYKKVLIPFKLEEQKLETPTRKGFTVVEWGGSKIK